MTSSRTIISQRVMSDWARASESMGHVASQGIYDVADAVGRSKGASDEQVSAAVPYIFLAVSRNGIDARAAAQRTIQSVMRSDWARAAGHDEVSIEHAAESGDALEVAIQAAGLGHDDVARSRGSLSRGSLGSLSDALKEVATHTPESALTVAALIADGLGKRVGRDYSGAQYVRLKVSTVAACKGVSRPRTSAQSLAIMTSACWDYALVEATREGAGDDYARRWELALDALAYVTRDRKRAATPAGEAGWEYVPDQSGEVSRAFQREMGKRVNTGGKGRSGPVCGQPMAGLPFESGQAYMPTDRRTIKGLDDLTQTAAKTSAQRANGLIDAIDVAGRVYDAREYGAPCKRYVVTVDGVLCACGPQRGTPLVATPMRKRAESGIKSTEREIMHLTHGLTVCPSPSTGEVIRCACGGKRGILTAYGQHKRR